VRDTDPAASEPVVVEETPPDVPTEYAIVVAQSPDATALVMVEKPAPPPPPPLLYMSETESVYEPPPEPPAPTTVRVKLVAPEGTVSLPDPLV
jgi:hypothetical protein